MQARGACAHTTRSCEMPCVVCGCGGRVTDAREGSVHVRVLCPESTCSSPPPTPTPASTFLSLPLPQNLRQHAYFGQYGTLLKVVVQRAHTPAKEGRLASAAAFLTFDNPESAKDAIQGCDGFVLEDRTLHCTHGSVR